MLQLVPADALGELLDEVVETVLNQVFRLGEVLAVLETAQRCLPGVAPAELERMKRGERPVSPVAYLLGRLEGAIVDLEDVIGYLEEDLGQGLKHVSTVQLTAAEFRDIEGAIRRVADERSRKR